MVWNPRGCGGCGSSWPGGCSSASFTMFSPGLPFSFTQANGGNGATIGIRRGLILNIPAGYSSAKLKLPRPVASTPDRVKLHYNIASAPIYFSRAVDVQYLNTSVAGTTLLDLDTHHFDGYQYPGNTDYTTLDMVVSNIGGTQLAIFTQPALPSCYIMVSAVSYRGVTETVAYTLTVTLNSVGQVPVTLATASGTLTTTPTGFTRQPYNLWFTPTGAAPPISRPASPFAGSLPTIALDIAVPSPVFTDTTPTAYFQPYSIDFHVAAGPHPESCLYAGVLSGRRARVLYQNMTPVANDYFEVSGDYVSYIISDCPSPL
jgi:hypothetical protein